MSRQTNPHHHNGHHDGVGLSSGDDGDMFSGAEDWGG